jgi:hypothetical protein
MAVELVRSVLGCFAGAAAVAVAGVPFLLKPEFCVRPSIGAAIIALMSGTYLASRLLLGEGTLKWGRVTADMPFAVRTVSDAVALAVLGFALWISFSSCTGSWTLL